ncbi:MAG TPA: GTP-binding protein [Candidatus Lokiarchaeia archaeon]|nr:GTP-binding protein [Candidatus Lokiarchaeia archaeon]
MPFTFKLILFGDGAVGKTTLAHRYVTGSFKEDTLITIGVEFHVKSISIDGENVDLQLWDLGGEERFRFILPAYALGAQGGVFLYDITSPLSLSHMGEWLAVLRGQAHDVPVIMAGTKADLDTRRKVFTEEAAEMGGKYGIPNIIEVSSKTGQNVDLLFETISRMMIEQITKNDKKVINPNIEIIDNINPKHSIFHDSI